MAKVIVPAGSKRFTYKRLKAIGANVSYTVSVRLTDAETGEPMSSQFWYKDAFGSNKDVLNGSSGKFTISFYGVGRASLRLWRHPSRPMLLEYSVDSELLSPRPGGGGGMRPPV